MNEALMIVMSAIFWSRPTPTRCPGHV